MSHRVIISLAANRFQSKNLSRARRCLEEVLSDIHYTSEHWTEPVHAHLEGKHGNSSCRHDAYLNQLAVGTTSMEETELNEWAKQTERSFGRNEQKRLMGIVPIDLDILEFDGERRHLPDWERSYIKELITELPIKDEVLSV